MGGKPNGLGAVVVDGDRAATCGEGGKGKSLEGQFGRKICGVCFVRNFEECLLGTGVWKRGSGGWMSELQKLLEIDQISPSDESGLQEGSSKGAVGEGRARL